MFSFIIGAVVGASAMVPVSSVANLGVVPVVVIDTRYAACSVEEQPYYFVGKADRRAAKIQAELRAQSVDFRVVRWEKDADVPDAAAISAMGPKKYLRNC